MKPDTTPAFQKRRIIYRTKDRSVVMQNLNELKSKTTFVAACRTEAMAQRIATCLNRTRKRDGIYVREN